MLQSIQTDYRRLPDFGHKYPKKGRLVRDSSKEYLALRRSLKVECGVFQEGTKFDAALDYDG